MQQEIERFLNLKTPPARLTAVQAAWSLGFAAHEIPILVAKGLLRPLGHPSHNAQKFFLSAALEDLRRDEKWFSKASDAVLEYWRNKNSRRSSRAPNGRQHSDQAHHAREFAEAPD